MPVRPFRPAVTLAAAAAACLLPAVPASADGGLRQNPDFLACVSETGSALRCQDGQALIAVNSAAVSPDGRNVYATGRTSDAITVMDRTTATGFISQKAGTAGCISETGTAGACQDGVALDAAAAVAVSPDGKNVYVAATTSDAVVVFDRAAGTGALTQKAGTAGCVSETGTAGACQDGVGLDGATSLAVSADGASVYVGAGGGSIAVFDRDPATGALTQKPGTAGCVSETGSAGACQDVEALAGLNGVAVSSDGRSLYAASGVSDAIAVFDRAASGALTQKPGTAGCLSETGTGGLCQDGVALDLARSVAVSPDGRTVYATSVTSQALVVADRDPATGAITQRAGTGGCISDTGTGGVCQDGTALGDSESVTVSPDSRSVYVTTSGAVDSLTVFDRDPATGATTQKAGAAGCLSDTGTAGACQDVELLDGIAGVAVSPDGRHLYAAMFSVSVVFTFDRGRFPTCTPVTRPVAAATATAVAVSCAHPDGFPVTYEVTAGPGKGTLSGLDARAGTFTYTPAAGATGVDTITFRARSGMGDSAPATVTLDLLPPVAGPAGPVGQAGPAGARGATGPPGLAVASFAKSLRARLGSAVPLRYLSTASGRATLEVRRSGKRVAQIRKATRRGDNTIAWNGRIGGARATAGRYELRLTVVSGAQTVRLRVPLTLRR